MTTRTRYIATYDYPGMLFPESITRTLESATQAAVLAAAPAETEGTYFVKDGWYAATVTAIVEKRYVGDDPTDIQWIEQRRDQITRFVVGDLVHVDDIPDDDRHSLLRSNLRANSKDGYGVRTRAGNWQIASDYDSVVSPAAVTR